jgi:hypothetical protein
MKELKDAFSLGRAINKMQDKIQAACKAATAAAAAVTATSNVANISITSSATSVDSSTFALTNDNDITASSESLLHYSVSLLLLHRLPQMTKPKLNLISIVRLISLHFHFQILPINHCQF